jgi:hypothetical protein
MKTYRHATNNPGVVEVYDEDGICRMTILESELPEGTVIEPALPPPPPTQEELDEQTACEYQKLRALANMSQSEIDTWVQSNVTDLNSARDAIKTLAKGMSVLLRRAFGNAIQD